MAFTVRVYRKTIEDDYDVCLDLGMVRVYHCPLYGGLHQVDTTKRRNKFVEMSSETILTTVPCHYFHDKILDQTNLKLVFSFFENAL